MKIHYPTIVFLLLVGFAASAQVPQTLSYQGLLTDATGNPLNGTQNVKFNFYTVATGGTVAFSRGPLEVAAFQGLFTVILGNGQGENNAGLPNLGSTQYYIGIRVGASTTDLSPRVQLTAVPYAFTASNLDPNATVSATQLTGTVPAERIAPSSIDDSKLVGISASKVTGNLPATQVSGLGTLATLSEVTSSQITDGTIAAADIAAGSIDNTKLANIVAFSAQSNSAIVIPNGVETTINNYNSVIQNSGGGFNSASGVFTCPRAGWYLFSGVLGFGIKPCYANFYYNFNQSSQRYFSFNHNVDVMVGSCVIYMNVNDTMQILGYQATGSIYTYYNPTNLNGICFSGAFIGN